MSTGADTEGMTTPTTAPISSFDVLVAPDGDRLLAAATAAATRAVDDPSFGVLVVVVRPESPDHQVISGGGTSVLRAAVAVAVGAGNDRLWRDAPTGSTVERPTRALPEVVAVAADAGGIHAVHTGCVRRGDVVDAVAIWFETWNGVARADERALVLEVLEHAAREEADRLATQVDDTVEVAPEPTAPSRSYAAEDVDDSTGLLTPEAFERHLSEFEGDEATILLVDIDDFDRLTTDIGDDADRIVREIADRLDVNCRREDLVGRLGDHRFGVMLGNIERSAVMHLAKRLLDTITESLPEGLAVDHVTATVALAHQVGLVDLDEMLDSAEAAMRSGQQAGAGRLILAA